MTRPKHLAVPPPRLVDAYADTRGDGSDVHRTYLRRWDDWHAVACGRHECLQHIPKVARGIQP